MLAMKRTVPREASSKGNSEQVGPIFHRRFRVNKDIRISDSHIKPPPQTSTSDLRLRPPPQTSTSDLRLRPPYQTSVSHIRTRPPYQTSVSHIRTRPLRQTYRVNLRTRPPQQNLLIKPPHQTSSAEPPPQYFGGRWCTTSCKLRCSKMDTRAITCSSFSLLI